MELNHSPADFDVVNRIVSFINEIGIVCQPGPIPDVTFLPGIDIRNGGIFYDPERLENPGDLLHEAGHLAVLLPEDRANDNLCGDISAAGSEMAAIAWSWAAREHLGIAPEILFHENGYKGGSVFYIENFCNGRYCGVPMLDLVGLTNQWKKGDMADDFTYPKLIKWVRTGQ
jgi:hypothetical protein